MSDDGLSLSCSEQVAAESHKSTRRDIELEMGAVSPILHVDEGSLAARRNLDCLADKLLRNVNREVLDRFTALTIDSLVQNLRLADLKFEALAAHSLDEHGKVKDTTSVNDERVGIWTRLHAESQILLKFLLKTLLQVA